MVNGAVDQAEVFRAADPADTLRSEIAGLKHRIAQLESESGRSARGPGPFTLEEFLQPIRRARQAWDLRRSTGRPEGKTVKVVQPTGMTLPAGGPLRREPPRKPEDRQPDYLEKFDSRTLFYDAFRQGDDVWLS